MSQPVDDAPVIIPVLLGSRRTNGNAAGLASWLGSQLTAATDGRFTLVPADDLVPRMPYGPVEDPVIPVMVADRPDGYADADVRAWSALVERSRALVVLTPQFNWGYPGHLKNALDHLYHEWKGKPVLLFTYGGHGGSKCASQLHQVADGLKIDGRGSVQITLPEEYIRGESRVAVCAGAEGVEWPKFLSKYEDEARSSLRALVGDGSSCVIM